MNNRLMLIFLLFCWGTTAAAADMELTPFRTVNQSPLVQIYGIPSESSALLTPSGKTGFSLVQDIASNYTVSATARERIVLDGESYRWTLAARYGFGEKYEGGIELPYILYGGGFLDSFIIEWHKFFGLPQGGRESAPKNRLGFQYVKDGVQKLRMNSSGSGIGDISLTGGMQLYDNSNPDSRDTLSLRGALKLPTGDTSSLRGSGSADLSLSICGGMNNKTEWGTLGLFGSFGGMAMTRSDVLGESQIPVVGFGTFGFGWSPARWISLKMQLNAHTPFYRGSTLDELSATSLMLISGGALKLPGGYNLDISVSEDVGVATAPDVSFHLGLSRRF